MAAMLRTLKLFRGQHEFVLSPSGHVPERAFRPPRLANTVYFTNETQPETAEEWLSSATCRDGKLVGSLASMARRRVGDSKKAPRTLAIGSFRRSWTPREATCTPREGSHRYRPTAASVRNRRSCRVSVMPPERLSERRALDSYESLANTMSTLLVTLLSNTAGQARVGRKRQLPSAAYR